MIYISSELIVSVFFSLFFWNKLCSDWCFKIEGAFWARLYSCHLKKIFRKIILTNSFGGVRKIAQIKTQVNQTEILSTMIHWIHLLLDTRTSDNLSVYIKVSTISQNMLLFNWIDFRVYQWVKYGVRAETGF